SEQAAEVDKERQLRRAEAEARDKLERQQEEIRRLLSSELRRAKRRLSFRLRWKRNGEQFNTISQNVDLSSRNLHVLERLSELNISNNAVAAHTLDENFLAHFPRLTTLNHNAIQSWTEASLIALPNLRSLHLGRNNISELTAEMFPRDCQLSELLVQNNRIGRIDPLVGTSRLLHLRQFRLARNRLHVSLNQSVSQSRKSRPDIFPHFPSVESLDLSQNGLEFVPPLMFGKWPSLKELRLSRNRLQFFGAGSFYIEGGGLHSLDLSNNRVASMNREIAYGLDELQILQLSHNDIRTVQTDAFEQLKKLQKLYLDHNQLSFIGGIFDPLSRLEVLRLSSNPNLAQLPSNAFGGLHRLKELDLSNNSIHVIDDKVFESLNQLRRLSLASNRLSMIRGGYFSGLVRLEELDLRGNNITGVEESESNDLKGMIFLRKLHLQTAHYQCGLCSLRAFVSWLRSKGFAEPEVSVLCASPPALRGHSVFNLRGESQAANCEIGLVPKVISHPPSEAKLVGQNLNLDCTILSNLPPLVTWQRAPMTLDAVAKSSAKPGSSSGAVSVGMVASGSAASGGDSASLLSKSEYSNLVLAPDQVSLIRSDKEWRAQLRLTQLNTSDSGLYRCSVTVSSSQAAVYSLAATIRVLSPPRFVQRPKPLYEANEGDSVEIPCASVGFPKPEQSLRRLGNFPAAVERRLTLPEGDAAKFGIRRLTSADTGRYICISENAGGRVETAFNLEVLTSPKFVSDSAWSARVGVRPGGDLVLDCKADANPAPNYAWYFNDQLLNNRSESQLRLTSAVLADAGVYQCEARNPVGLVSRRVQLVVGNRPIVEVDDGAKWLTTTTRRPPSPPVSTADGGDVDGSSKVSTGDPGGGSGGTNFSLLIFAVVVSATSCVLLTTLLWCVVFVFLRSRGE
uniref:Ig-like domain-containing protein n=1 Tax=Macrostomum lignano TaxID=282301 RepID=A0A1I8HJM4_9PLAT